jgi:hypothetical protein
VSTIPNLALASEDWQLSDENGAKPGTLVVGLRRHTYVLPYFRFVSAEGDNSQVTVAFSSHLVTITGHGLTALLAALATQRVMCVLQPSENEVKFGVRGSHRNPLQAPSIIDITVEPLH